MLSSKHTTANAVSKSCEKIDKSVRTRYGITGYFMYTSNNKCTTKAQLERAHKIGADTIVTFGSTLKSSSADKLAENTKDNIFKRFVVKGKKGYDHARQFAGNVRINRVFTYKNNMTFSKKALACGNKNGVYYDHGYDEKGKKFTNVFTWWLFPIDNYYSSCSSPSNTYDLVVAYSPSPSDANDNLVKTAKQYGMTAYLGLPKPQLDAKIPYVADVSYTHTLGSFTTRVLATWNERFGTSPAFSGVYQTLETAAFTSKRIWSNNLKVYTIQNKIVQYQLPKAKERVIISPYADFTKRGVSTQEITKSYTEIVKTGSGAHIILAPQDGVGTGRVGIDRVKRLYSAAKKAGAHEFWANIESFKPGGIPGQRPASDKKTVDAQIIYARPYASKIISFDWNYMEKAGIPKTLLGE